MIATSGFFGDTISKGKKNDHVFHNACLEHVINFYDKERSDENLPAVKINIIHTDNWPPDAGTALKTELSKL